MAAFTEAQNKYLRDLAGRWEKAERGERQKLAAEGMEQLGVSRATLYRLMRQVGALNERRTRSDCGRRSVTPEKALAVSGLIQTARRANGKQTMPMELAADIAAANGMGGLSREDMPSMSTLSRTMRELGCHPSQLKTGKATGRLRSPHPNWCWQVDASVCVLWYLPGGKMSLLDERVYNARKPGRLAEIGNLRITRYVVVDHCTGFFYVHYAQEKGESATGVLATLIEAMADRGAKDPMHGVPFHIYMDKSGGNKSGLLTEFCRRMGIEPIYHAAGTANATGAVEVCQNIVERNFESRLRFADVADLAGLQSMADRWRRHFMAHAKHSRLGCSRSTAWCRITPEQLRTASRDAMQAIAHWKREERTVSRSLTIAVDTRLPDVGVREYDLRALAYAGLNKGDKVLVELNPFEAPAVTVCKTMPDGEERRWTVKPMEKDEFGFDTEAAVIGQNYKAQPDTVSDKAIKEIAVQAAPTEEAKAAGVKHPYSHIDAMEDVKEPRGLYFRQKGSDILAEQKKTEAVPLTLAQALRRLRDMAPEAFNKNAPGCRAAVQARFPQTVPETALEELAEHLRNTFTPKVHVYDFTAVLQRAAGGEK